MMARRRTNSRGRSRQAEGIPWLLLSLFVVVVAIIGGGLGWMYFRASSQNVRVTAELCPEAGPTEQTIVLVDATDPIAQVTQIELMNKLADLAMATPKGGRFELRLLDPGSERTRTLFSRCNPGDGSDLDEYTGNPEMARKRWVGQFSEPLQSAMTDTVRAPGADTSPIMAGIQKVAVDRLSTGHTRAIPNRLVVVSDMLENSGAFSVYQSGTNFEEFRKTLAHRRYSTDLANAIVSIWFLERETKVPSIPLIEFWVQWIQESRGQPDRITRMQGMN